METLNAQFAKSIHPATNNTAIALCPNTFSALAVEYKMSVQFSDEKTCRTIYLSTEEKNEFQTPTHLIHRQKRIEERPKVHLLVRGEVAAEELYRDERGDKVDEDEEERHVGETVHVTEDCELCDNMYISTRPVSEETRRRDGRTNKGFILGTTSITR